MQTPSKRLLVDLSSILWTSLKAGTDKEFGFTVEFNGRKTLVNSAEYGYENAINHLVAALDANGLSPVDMILVVEGLHSKLLRQSVMPTYKGGDAPSHPPEAYLEFDKLRQRLITTFTALGAQAVTQDGVEADDVLAYLALHLKGEKIIDTADRDLAVLISDGSTPTTGVCLWRDGRRETENPLGPFPCKYITVFKALVGDTSDKIPGAKGFGETAWLNLLVNFGVEGLENLHQLYVTRQLARLAEDVAEFKPLQKILDDMQGSMNSFIVAKLYPEKVNTLRKPLQWTAGMVKPRDATTDERLKQWAGAVRLIHSGNYDDALAFFKAKLAESPFVAFDIETSTSDRSDDWLKIAQGLVDGEEDRLGVDVFGSTLTGFATTFGKNNQYTFYWTHAHLEQPGVTNITKEQAKAVLQAIPPTLRTIVHNAQFELPVIYEDLGPLQADEEALA
jgi:5'-3' exonuclease